MKALQDIGLDPSAASHTCTSPGSARGWFVLALLLGVSLAASSLRIVLAPGFELYLGPFFYLIAYRAGGLKLALGVALLVMVPSYFWWGHIISIVLAVAHVLFIDRFGRGHNLTVPTLAFQTTVGAAGVYLFLSLYYGAPDVVIALNLIRKLLNDVLMATLADLVCSVTGIDLARGAIIRRRTVHLASVLPAAVTLIAICSSVALFVAEVRRFPEDFARSRAEVMERAELEIRRGTPAVGAVLLPSAPNDSLRLPDMMIAPQAEQLLRANVMNHLGCTRIDDGSPVTGPNDRNTFAFWLAACQLGQVRVGRQDYAYLYATRSLAERGYRDTLLEMTGPGIILILSLLLQFLLTRSVKHSILAWRHVVEAFGRPGISQPIGPMFYEFEGPLAAIIDANNRFASLVDERRRLADATRELKAEMDLRLVTEIVFDRERGVLRMREINIDSPARLETIAVHPNDCLALSGIASEDDAFAEFRIDGSAGDDWYLLSVRGLEEPGCWRSGWIVRLRQSKLANDRLLQQARLIELGGMASALSHELKQPLFTISLSAENGRLLIGQGTDAGVTGASAKFERIIEQVSRASDIMARITRYSRVEDNDPHPVDLGEVINTALILMRPLMIQKNVRARADTPASLLVLAPRVGIEQLLVNAVQNSVDAIAARRDTENNGLDGEILVTVTNDDLGVHISITDNGTGLVEIDPELAFGAFETTKPAESGTGLGLYISRQIVMEMSGQVRIQSVAPPGKGAVMTIDLPTRIIAKPKTIRGKRVRGNAASDRN